MRFIIGFLSGVLGALAGWFGLAMLVIALAGHDQDGGIAMGAFFNIGPFGGIAGFIAGVVLFLKFGQARAVSPAADAAQPQPAAAAAPVRTRVSRPFAIVVVAILAGLGWWGWYELIRSPYLSHGFMTLDMQFRLPAGMDLPPDPSKVRITVEEGGQYLEAGLGPAWHGTDEGRRVILAHVTLSMKTGRRSVTLALPGVAEQSWPLGLSSDPDPMPGFTDWKLADGKPSPAIEMNYKLTAER